MRLKKIGMRNIKTGIAVMLCSFTGYFLIDNPFFACVACVFAMQNTVEGSFKMGFNRIRGTIVGGIVGLVLTCIQPNNPILSGLGVMITIYICNLLKTTNQSITVGSITFLAIHLGSATQSPLSYAINRTIDTSFGVLVGMIVNYFIAKPNHIEYIIKDFNKMLDDSNNLIYKKMVHDENIDSNIIQQQIIKLDGLNNKLVAELDYSTYDLEGINLKDHINSLKEIYFHIQAIEFLDKRCYMTSKNYSDIKSIYKIDKINFEVNDEESPVFNYHISRIILKLDELKECNKNRPTIK